jgi:polar amino acid transport system permease protein
VSFSWGFFLHGVLPQLVAAVPVTMTLTLLSAAGSALLGVPLALALGAAARWKRWPAEIYALLIRGTPMLVQIYMIYYGLGSLIPREWMRHSWAAPMLRDAFWYGLVALTLNETAYVAVILKAGLEAIPRGQREAASALGMSGTRMLARILLPQALGVVFPMLANEFILLLKSTVLVSTITIFDVMGTANIIRFETLRVDEPLVGAALVYVVLVGSITLIWRPIERRLGRHVRHP